MDKKELYKKVLGNQALVKECLLNTNGYLLHGNQYGGSGWVWM